MSSKIIMLCAFLAAVYSITIGMTSAFPYDLIPAHLIGFDHANNIQQHARPMSAEAEIHHHHIGMFPASLDRMNLEASNQEINAFGQRTTPTRYGNPINAHSVHPTIMYNQPHRQAHQQFSRLNPAHQYSQQQYQNRHDQQNVASMNYNNFNALLPAHNSGQFQPEYNGQSNEVSSQESSMSQDRHDPIGHLMKHYDNRQVGVAESREDHQQAEDRNGQHEESKKDDESQANHNEEYKQPEAEKKHDEAASHHEGHHEEHHNMPNAIEVHHKKGGKSFQYFHQQHS